MQDVGISRIHELGELISKLGLRHNSVTEPLLFEEISLVLKPIQELRETLSFAEELELQKRFQNVILPFTNQSEFCHYSYTKPRGYAGDFFAMEMIWRGRTEPEKYRYKGSTRIGEILNAYTFDSANCLANIERVHYLKKVISKYHNARIASIGSGSIIELRELLKEGRLNGNEYHLYDGDLGSFNYIESICGRIDQFVFCPGNVLRTILGSKLPRFDLIYCSGIFDYLSDKSASKIAESLWASVNPGGMLLITNAHPGNPTKFWNEYVGDWYLNYRTEPELMDVINFATGAGVMEINPDKAGVYLYATIKKAS